MVDDLDLPDGDRLGDPRLLVLDPQLVGDLARVVNPFGQAGVLCVGGGQPLLTGPHLIQRGDPRVEGRHGALHAGLHRVQQIRLGRCNQHMETRQVWMRRRAARQ